MLRCCDAVSHVADLPFLMTAAKVDWLVASRWIGFTRKQRTMQIIDAQIHLWATGLPSNPTHWAVTHFTADEAIALMDEGSVDAAVIHPPDWDDSTELAFKAVRDYPGRFAIMGSLPLDQSSSRARIAGWRQQQQPGMLGLRYSFLNDPARRWLADGTIDWLWAEAEKASVPIYMIATDSLAEIAHIAERRSLTWVGGVASPRCGTTP
jgi:hypothetical protein